LGQAVKDLKLLKPWIRCALGVALEAGQIGKWGCKISANSLLRYLSSPYCATFRTPHPTAFIRLLQKNTSKFIAQSIKSTPPPSYCQQETALLEAA